MRWAYCTNREAEVEEADGSSSREEGAGLLSLFVDMKNWELKADLSTMATLFCG